MSWVDPEYSMHTLDLSYQQQQGLRNGPGTGLSMVSQKVHHGSSSGEDNFIQIYLILHNN